MSGKKIFAVLIFIIALTAIVKSGTINTIDYIDRKIDSQIDKWANKHP